ncbi:MAG: VCBS repeat-containing protein, partial [Anaerolineales bacterium]|nr:VCBS repeat-containing protein [Anaerolineales bacterium]
MTTNLFQQRWSKAVWSFSLSLFFLTNMVFILNAANLTASPSASTAAVNTDNLVNLDTSPEYFFENMGYPSAWGDMDQDGDMDVVLQGKYDTLYVYLNNGRDHNGHLNFTIGTQLPAPLLRRHITLGDLDNDDDLDIVVVGLNSQPPTIYQNPGVNQAGAFNTAVWPSLTLPLAGDSDSLAYHADLGDMNGDGKLDIAIANVGAYSEGLGKNVGLANQVFQNVSTGSTISMTEVSISTLISVSVKAKWVDIDNDNKLDLTFANGYGDGVGGLSESLEFCHNITTNANSPEFDCQEVIPQTTGAFLQAIEWGHLNNNSIPDLVLGDYFELNVFYDVAISDTTLIPDIKLNNSSGQYVSQVASIELGDADSDGDLDILVAQGEKAILYQNDGGVIAPTTPVWQAAFSIYTTKAHFVDTDNDGDFDVSLSGGNISMIFSNNGRGFAPTPTITTTLTTPPAPTAFGLAWGDVDNDGDLGLATRNSLICNG